MTLYTASLCCPTWTTLGFIESSLSTISSIAISSSGSLDVAGLVNGNIFVTEMIITEAGSVRGSIEAANIEVNGHVEGKISADVVIVGKNAVIKGDIFFKNTLKTEEGADIASYMLFKI